MAGHRARRHLLGRPLAAPSLADLDRLVCLSGQIELRGPSCVDDVAELTAVTVVDGEGLQLLCRSAGHVAIRCGAVKIELVGEIGVVVGSREEQLWSGRAVRTLATGDRVVARGMLRRRAKETQSGYRDGRVREFALAPFGAFPTIDVAYNRRPKGIKRRDGRALLAWLSKLLPAYGRVLRPIVVLPDD